MIEFEYTLDLNGHDLAVNVEAEGHVYGHNYGEDADGNRGEWRVECEDIVLKITDSRGNDNTKKIETKYEGSYETIEDMAYEKLIEADDERKVRSEPEDYEDR